MHTVKANNAMNANRVSIIAKGNVAEALVLPGAKERDTTGLNKARNARKELKAVRSSRRERTSRRSNRRSMGL